MKKIFLFAIIACSVCSCQQRHIDKRLILSDTLTEQGLTDSAFMVLKRMIPSSLNREEKMYYQLLQAIIAYKNYEYGFDETLDSCIKYYEQTDDKRKLALSLLYRGLSLAENGNYDLAVEYLKKVETLSSEINDVEIQIRVRASLCSLNFQTGNYQKAFQYSKDALALAEQKDNKRWQGFCLDAIATSCSRIGYEDSSYIYMECEIPFIRYQPIREQAVSYRNVANRFSLINKRDSAYYYYHKSIKVYPLPETYGLLAELYCVDGKADLAAKLWEKAFMTKDLRYQELFRRSYAEWLYHRGDKDKAFAELCQAFELKDSLPLKRQAEAIADIQKTYDSELAQERFRFDVMILASIIVVLTLSLLFLWQFSRYRQQKTKRILLENEMQLKEYTRQVEQLTSEGKEHSKEVKALNRRIKLLQDKQSEILYKGKARFEEIANGGKAITWKKADFNDFLEYYRTQNLPFVVHLENDYQSLSPSQKFIMVLQVLGHDDKAIQDMMGMSDGAFRTARSRIHSRQLRPLL